MSFNRSGYIGRAPGDSAITIAKQYFQPTSVGKTFTFSSGYDPGLIDVYRNGVKLVNVLDYAATDGSTIVLDTPVGVGSTVQVVAYKAFNAATVKATELDTTVTGTTINLGGNITAANATISALTTTVDINVSGGATVGGTMVANAFSGDGSNITGIGTHITTEWTLGASGTDHYTFTGPGNLSSTNDPTLNLIRGVKYTFKNRSGGHPFRIQSTANGSAGTAYNTGVTNNDGGNGTDIIIDVPYDAPNILYYQCTAHANMGGVIYIGNSWYDSYVGGASTITGVTKITDTTETTSTTTGAVIISGGVGIAKSLRVGTELHVGSNVTIGGTLTYEDVTNIDSVGLVTARAGVNVSGGQFLVGSGVTIGNAGVATFSGTGDVHLLDSVRLNVGDASDLAIYHNGSHSFLENGTGALVLKGSDVNIQSTGGVKSLYAYGSGIELNYSGNKKFETTNDGTVTTGIATATGGLEINADNKKLQIGAGADLSLFHNATNSEIKNATGTLYLESDGTWIVDKEGSDKMAKFLHDSSVELYYDNSKKFETSNDGTVTTGIATATGGLRAYLGAGARDDFSTSADALIIEKNGDTGISIDPGSTGQAAIFFPNESNHSIASLTHNNSTGVLNVRGENIVTLSTNSNTERVRVTAAGKCGIGTTNPQQLLHVEAGSGESYVQIDTNSNGGILLDVQGTQRSVFANDSAFSANIINTAIGAKNDLRIRTGGSYTERLLIGEAGISTFSDTPHDDKGDLRSIPINIQGSTYTLVAADAGKAILASGTVTVPNSVFSTGDAVTIINNTASNLTITKTITTMYNASDATSANRTLATRGTCTIYFESGTIAYISGAGLS